MTVLGCVYYINQSSESQESEEEENIPDHVLPPENNWENNEEIEIFRDYLRIRTDHPDINYGVFTLFDFLWLEQY